VIRAAALVFLIALIANARAQTAGAVKPELIYTGEVFGNLGGGFRRGAIYEGLLDARLTLDLEKLAGFRETTLFASALYPHGESLTQNYVHDFNVASNIDAYDTLRLNEVWIEKDFGGKNDGVSVRAGKLAFDTEFFVSEAGGVFINSCFGEPATIGQVSTFPTYPLTAPGVRVEIDRDTWILRAGAFSGNAGEELRNNKHGLRFGLSAQDGALFLGEINWRTPEDADKVRRAVVKLGGYYDSAEFPDIRDATVHRHGNYGAYFSAEGQVLRTGTGNRGVTVFSRASVAPDNRNIATWYLETGGVYTGLFYQGDTLGLGANYTKMSDEFPAKNGVPAHHETILELTYQSAEIAHHLRIQPDFQYVWNPGGTTRAADAIIAGLRFVLWY